ncbi:EAL domain-containing protein [Catellatospora tritici]|uniref:EAL domain-containing protein n=1 Tax=Catellatospora tritici TaxID=2851566 RepID=UPI001C2CCE33|nr:EAL domain-containing protein [Catellatospora tritici]MBV1856629.1 EAL domain-containing protein [Catellatospora tritici]
MCVQSYFTVSVRFWAYAAVGVLAGVGLWLWPAHQLAWWAVLGAGAFAAVITGVRANRPRRCWPWLLAAAALALFSVGNVVHYAEVGAGGTPAFTDGRATFLFVAAFPAITAATAGLAWVSVVGRDRIMVLDAMIVASGLGLLVWMFIIAPQWGRIGDGMAERFLSTAFPLCDLVIAAISVSLALVAWRVQAVRLLCLAAGGLIWSDMALILARRHPVPHLSTAGAAGWVLFYLGWGLAALHPSMVLLTEPASVKQREIGRGYQVLLTSFIAVPLTVLLVDVARGVTKNNLVALLFLAITLVLVLLRLTRLIDDYRHSMALGRVVLDINAAMFAAHDAGTVMGLLRDSPGELLPSGVPHTAVVDLPRADRPSAVSGLPDHTAHPVYVRDLPPEVRPQMDRFAVALVCPIRLPGHPAMPTADGALVVGAAERWLTRIQTSLEILTAQAALAVDRINTITDLDRRHSEEYFQTLVRNTTDVILILEPDRDTIRYASPSAVSVFGTDALAGRSVRNLATPLDRTKPAPPASATEDWTVDATGQAPVTVEASWQDLRDDPTIRGWVLTLRDVTAPRKLEAELTELAFHDPLTGLANRALFNDRLRTALVDAAPTGTTVGVLYVDLDDFKMVNDSYGHETGDALLKAAAGRLTATLRPGMLAARLGGDEFAVLIGNAPAVEAVEKIADDVVTAMSRPFLVNGRMLPGAASIGIAVNHETADAAELLRQADQAQYAAKTAGKRQWRRFDPSQHGLMLDRLALRTDLAHALDEGSGLTIEYQPIVELATGVIAGCEALIRWDHPDRGRLMPQQFIDLAEDSGLIVALGRRVLATAIDTAAAWPPPHTHQPAPYVSVNVSVRQFQDPGFTDTVRTALAAAGLPPHRLMLEITESLLLHDDDNTWQTLAELRQHGIRIAIDDFGTGYSALSYLRQVPVDILKIDRSFTSTITTSTRQAALVDVIITLAETLNLDVVAEGIETTAERDLLQHFGCRYGQGYLYAKPLTRDQVAARISADGPQVDPGALGQLPTA